MNATSTQSSPLRLKAAKRRGWADRGTQVEIAVGVAAVGFWMAATAYASSLFAPMAVLPIIVVGVGVMALFAGLSHVAGRARIRTWPSRLRWIRRFRIMVFRSTDATVLNQAQSQVDAGRGSLLRSGDFAVYYAAVPNLRSGGEVLIVADWHSLDSATTEPTIDYSVDRIESAWMMARRWAVWRKPMALVYSGDALTARMARIGEAVAALAKSRWMVSLESTAPIEKWRRQADPSTALPTAPVRLVGEAPVGVVVNVPVVRMALRRKFDVTFLPDRLVIDTPRMVTALDYRALRCRAGVFETLMLDAPPDAEVREFQFLRPLESSPGADAPDAAPAANSGDNPLLPVVRLGFVEMEDLESGFRAILWMSRADAAAEFVAAMRAI